MRIEQQAAERVDYFIHHGLLDRADRDGMIAVIVDLHKTIGIQDRALDAALAALIQLSKTGSLRRDVREETIEQIVRARNERLF